MNTEHYWDSTTKVNTVELILPHPGEEPTQCEHCGHNVNTMSMDWSWFRTQISRCCPAGGQCSSYHIACGQRYSWSNLWDVVCGLPLASLHSEVQCASIRGSFRNPPFQHCMHVQACEKTHCSFTRNPQTIKKLIARLPCFS